MNNVFEKSNYLVWVGLRPDLKPARNTDWARVIPNFEIPSWLGHTIGAWSAFLFFILV